MFTITGLTLRGRKATIVALIVVNEINISKRMRFEAIHSNRYISRMNDLLFLGFRQITH